MYSLEILFIFILGCIIGSFINVISLRYNTGLSISRGRSKCFSCSVSLKWYELIPLFSFFLLQGKCRSCRSPISLQYPLVEFLTGVIFVGIAYRQFSLWYLYSTFEKGLTYSVLFFIYYIVIFSLLMVILIYDMRHKIIPNVFVYTFIVLSLMKLLLFVYLRDFVLMPIDILDMLTPLILFTPFALLWLVSEGKWIGFGDAKLAFGIGALLGLSLGVSSIVLAFWIGAVWSIGLILHSKLRKNKSKNINFKSEVPFAPFMIIATLIVFFAKIDIFGLDTILIFLYQ